MGSFKAVVPVVGVWLGLLGLSFPPAQAATPGCSIYNRCYSVLHSGNPNGTQFAGMHGTWARGGLGVGCPTDHTRKINSEMWMVPYQGGWVETGDTAGTLQQFPSCDYYQFAAWQSRTTGVYAEKRLDQRNHDNTLTDEFQISRSGTTNVFRIFFDGLSVVSYNVGFWQSPRLDMGGEVGTPDGSADEFHMYGSGILPSGTWTALPGPQTGGPNQRSTALRIFATRFGLDMGGALKDEV